MEPKPRNSEIAGLSEEEQLLIELWAEKLPQLRGPPTSVTVYLEMSFILSNNFTPREIRLKIDNLSNRYRKEQNNIICSGGLPSQWVLYKTVHEILGSVKINDVKLIAEDSFLELHFETASSFYEDVESIEAFPSPSKRLNKEKGGAYPSTRIKASPINYGRLLSDFF